MQIEGTPPDRSAQLRDIQSLQRTRGVEHIARVSRICRAAHERNELAEINGLASPVKPLDYLASMHLTVLSCIRDALEAGQLDSAAEIVRNVGPLFDSMSHLNAVSPEAWDAVLEAAEQVSHSEPNSLVRGVIIVQFSRRDRVGNKWPSARALAEKAIAWCKAHPNRNQHVLTVEVDAFESLGEVYRSMGGDYLTEAIVEFEHGLEAAATLQDPEARRNAELRLHDRRGYALFLEGRFAAARIELLASVLLHEKPTSNPAELSRTYNNLAKVSSALGRPTIARLYLERSLLLKLVINDKRGQAICHHEIGLLHISSGDFMRGMDSLEKSRVMKLGIEDRHGVGLTLMEMGFATDKLRQLSDPENEDSYREQAEWLFTGAEMFLTHDSPQEMLVRKRLGKAE